MVSQIIKVFINFPLHTSSASCTVPLALRLPWQPPISARHCTLTVDLELAKDIKPTEDDIHVAMPTGLAGKELGGGGGDGSLDTG